MFFSAHPVHGLFQCRGSCILVEWVFPAHHVAVLRLVREGCVLESRRDWFDLEDCISNAEFLVASSDSCKGDELAWPYFEVCRAHVVRGWRDFDRSEESPPDDVFCAPVGAVPCCEAPGLSPVPAESCSSHRHAPMSEVASTRLECHCVIDKD